MACSPWRHSWEDHGKCRSSEGDCVTHAEDMLVVERFGQEPDFMVEHQQTLAPEREIHAPGKAMDVEIPCCQGAGFRCFKAAPTKPVVARQQA